MRRGVEGGSNAFMAKGTACDVSRRARGSMWLEHMSKGWGWRGNQGPYHTESHGSQKSCKDLRLIVNVVGIHSKVWQGSGMFLFTL